MVNKYTEYYAILGLSPGSGPEDVKKAFRNKIKQHHPDTSRSSKETEAARRLIEAYHALKKGPPPEAFQAERASHSTYGDRETRGAYDERSYANKRHYNTYPFSDQKHEPKPDQKRQYSYRSGDFNFGREAGRRLYEEIYGSKIRGRRKPSVEQYWDILSQMVYGDDSEAQYYGENIEVREYHPRYTRTREADIPNTPLSGSMDQAVMYFNRAEVLLRETVSKYDDSRSFKRKAWLKEYIARLTNIQVLFRDVANRHPIMSGKATRRVQQIRELTAEIRQML